jgi:hypothetical protein
MFMIQTLPVISVQADSLAGFHSPTRRNSPILDVVVARTVAFSIWALQRACCRRTYVASFKTEVEPIAAT